MNKFNALGMEVLEYKTEYSKKYPELVHNCIGLAIDNKTNITDEIKNKLKDTSFATEEFQDFLLTQTSCLKTYEELLVEYEDLRNAIDSILVEKEIGKTIKTFSKVEEEQLQLIKEFVITEDFIRNYFNIESEKEFEVLMSRKGFIEKFAILRLTKIFKDFIKTLNKDDFFDVNHTLVFFSSESNVYGIHLEFTIPIDILDDRSKIAYIANKVIEISEKADKNFEDRMLI